MLVYLILGLLWGLVMLMMADSNAVKALEEGIEMGEFNPKYLYTELSDEWDELRKPFRVVAVLGAMALVYIIFAIVAVASGHIFKSLVFKRKKKED